jgi:O-antigen ligase
MLLAAATLPVLIAYLVVVGQWLYALALLVAVPAVLLVSRYPFAAVLVWLALDPFLINGPGALRPVYWSIHRALPLVTLGFMLINIVLGVSKRKAPRLGWPEVAMGGYILVSLLSIIGQNGDPQATFYLFYDRVIAPMCIYMVVRLWVPDDKDIRQFTWVALFLVVSQMVIAMLAWFHPGVLPSQWLGWAGQRSTGSLDSYGAFAAAMLFGGLVLFHAASDRSSGLSRRYYYWLIFALAFFGVFFSFSRAAWLAEIAVLAGLFLLSPKVLIRLALIGLPIALLLFAGPLSGALRWANERLYSVRSENSALSRLPVYVASVRMVEARPAFGWGYENFNLYDWQFYGRVGDFVNADKDHSSHNFYLTLLAEQGLVGFALFMTPLVWWLVMTLKAWREIPAHGPISRRLLVVLWLFIIGYVIVNLFQSMRIVFGLGLWWVALGLIASVVDRYLNPITFDLVARRAIRRGEPWVRERNDEGKL